MKKYVVLLTSFVLVACAASGPSQYVVGMQQYQGQTEAQLIDALGPPDKTYDVGHTRYLTYVKASQQVYRSGNPSYGYGVGMGRGGFGTGIGFEQDFGRSEVYTSRCDVFFAIDNHRVTKVGHRGNAC